MMLTVLTVALNAALAALVLAAVMLPSLLDIVEDRSYRRFLAAQELRAELAAERRARSPFHLPSGAYVVPIRQNGGDQAPIHIPAAR